MRFFMNIFAGTLFSTLVLGCDKLTVDFGEAPVDNRSLVKSFKGLESALLLPSGQLELFWQSAEAYNPEEVIQYKVYHYSQKEALASVKENLSALSIQDEAAALTATESIYKLPEEFLPTAKGRFFDSVNTRNNILIDVSRLEVGRVHIFQVVASDSKNVDFLSDRVFIYQYGFGPLEVFRGIEALVSVLHGTVHLSWAATTEEDISGYRIYEGEGFDLRVATVGPTFSHYEITGLAPDRIVIYGVRAVNSAGVEDSNTRTLSVAVLNTQTPTFGGLISATRLGQRSASLRWNAAEGRPKEYRVYHGITETGTSTGDLAVVDLETPIAIVPAPATSVTITNLGDDQEHHFVVRAATSGDAEDQNTEVKVVGVPHIGAPIFAGIKSASVVSGGIAVSWDKAIGRTANYKVYASTSATGLFSPANFKDSVAGTETSAVITGLTDNSTWVLGVRAIDQLSSEDTNNVMRSVALGDSTPPIFLGFAGVGAEQDPTSEAQLTVYFKKSADPDVNRYSIRTRRHGSAEGFVERLSVFQPSGAGDITRSITGLTGNTAYDVQVKVIDTSGNISISDVFVTATTVDLTPPSFAGINGFTFTGTATPPIMTASWPAASSNDAVQYRVYYSTSAFNTETFSKNNSFPLIVNGKTIHMKLVSAPTLSRALTIATDGSLDFVHNQRVFAMVRATDASGNEDSNTAQRSFDIPNIVPPTFAGIATAASVSSTKNAALTWVPANNPSNAASQYLVYVSKVSGTFTGPPLIIAAPASGTTISIDPATNAALDELTTYYFKVNARNINGLTDPNSVELGVTIPDIVPPVFAGLSSVSADGATEELVLSFDTATDTQGVKEYHVYWRTASSGSFQTLGSPGKVVTQAAACATTPCTIRLKASDGLVAEVAYDFRVDAVDTNTPVANTVMSGVTQTFTFPDFTPPASPSGVAKSPEPTGTTAVRNYIVTGTGPVGLTVRVYCHNLTTSTTLALGTCGSSNTVIPVGGNFSVNVTLPAESASFMLRAALFKPGNNQESTRVDVGAAVTLDQTAPSPVAFGGCPAGYCLSRATIGGSGSIFPSATLSLRSNEAGKYQLRRGATLLRDINIVANSTYTTDIVAADLVAGSNDLSLLLIDAAGNQSPTYSLTVSLDSIAPAFDAASFRMTRVVGTEDANIWRARWSISGLAPGETITITQAAGSTAPTTIAPVQVKAQGIAHTTNAAQWTGALTDTLPQSFTLFACDAIGNCATSSIVMNGGFSDLRNDSDGGFARYIWDSPNTSLFAYSTSQSAIENWDGLNTNPGDPTVIVEGAAGCLDSTVGCALDYTALSPWTKRYIRISVPSTDGRGVSLSPLYIYGRVPDGMVYVDKAAWPDEPGLTFKDWEKFSFAIDKFEGRLSSGSLDGSSTISAGGNGIIDSLPTGSPLQGANWYAYKRGCLNRSANWPTYVSSTEQRKIHLATGLAWVTAAYKTPDRGGAGFCNIDDRGRPATPTMTGVDINVKCVSRFGARNMIGNQWEWTDELLHNRQIIRNYGTADNSEVEALPFPVSAEVTGSVNVLDWEPLSSLPVIGTRVGPWTGTSDFYWQAWTTLSTMPTSALSRSVQRGAAWNGGAGAGRFTNIMTNAPTGMSTDIGGRCALVAPAPGYVRFRNDSDGNQARFRWKFWGETATVRIAFAKTREGLNAWTGGSVGASLASDVYTIANYTGCTDTGYNSLGNEVLGTGTTTSGALGNQGRCGVSLSSLAPWEKRYVRLYAQNTAGEVFSDIFVIAHVPVGMVFVSADDWPDMTMHRVAAEYGEVHIDKYDYAIDKYETSASGTVPQCTTADFPCTTAGFTGHLVSTGAAPVQSLNWYSHKQGCDNRTAVLHALNSAWVDNAQSVGNPAGRRVHLATGPEWVTAAFETPDTPGTRHCHILGSFWSPGAPAVQTQTGTNSMEFCVSRYGARNSIGNQSEWTDDVAHNGLMRRYWTSSNDGVDVGLLGSWNVVGNFVLTWDFFRGFPTATTATQAAGYSNGDILLNALGGALSTAGSRARAVRRGGDYHYGSQEGRFATLLDHPPTVTAPHFGGRCALRAPAP